MNKNTAIIVFKHIMDKYLESQKKYNNEYSEFRKSIKTMAQQNRNGIVRVKTASEELKWLRGL